jgi:histidinol dehydrogenase
LYLARLGVIMLKKYDPESARKTILKRQPIDEVEIPEQLKTSIEDIFGESLSPTEAVRIILKNVREDGDKALRTWAERLDGVAPDHFRVLEKSLNAALRVISPEQLTALETAAQRIRQFHELQPVTSWLSQDMGGTVGQLVRPIERVGLYIPAGSAPLPSSVLMSGIPAQVAGVKEIVLVAPPKRGTFEIDATILAAAAVLGISEVYVMGGAQAIAALAYGTESVARVDKIFGPGNIFVTLAKRQVYGTVGIDSIAGPTETVVIADELANPRWIAADLLAQAEHDVLASAILLTPSEKLIENVQIEVDNQVEHRSRAEVIKESLNNLSGAVLTEDLDEAVELSNRYGPEHLCLAVQDPWRLAEKVKAAGGIFMGEHSFEVLGDYSAGPSHVMPTGGSARFASPLNVLDFVHFVSLIALNPETTRKIAPTAAIIADMEGLDAHANAARVRL